MSWTSVVVLASILSAGSTINKPVYKIMLTQKGFAQFLQYDVEIPPLREFTFCAWIRVNDFNHDQSIFTYVVNGNNRIVRLWLDTGGHYIKVTINEKLSSSVPVEIGAAVWRHVCLSYQSDYGAWALYIDSRLVSCEAAQSLYGYVIPGSGSIIVGYGTTGDDNGSPNGLEGEIFGANMILASTIERNYTIKNHPKFEQKSFQRNKIKNNNNIEYIVLKDLQTDEGHNNVENALLPPNPNKSYIKVKTPYSFVEHDVGRTIGPTKLKQTDTSSEREILDIVTEPMNEYNNNKINFWNVVNEAGRIGKFRVQQKLNKEQSGSGTRDVSMLSEYEMPPPLDPLDKIFLGKPLEMEKPPVSESIYKIHEDTTTPAKSLYNKRHMNDITGIAEVETPPPLRKETKVYGQWTSSKFAGSVLNYLKGIKFRNYDKKVPATIPLHKISDTFPYASELKFNIVRPAIIPLKRKNLFIEKRKYNQNTFLRQSPIKRLHINKRNAKEPQINVQILEDNVRSEILRSHAQTKPENVEVTVRGEANKQMDKRFYRNVDIHSFENSDIDDIPRPFTVAGDLKNHKMGNEFDNHNHLLSGLPFLKSVEYFTEDSENISSVTPGNRNDLYSKSLLNGNKWHNVKSYSNDYTPRRINMTPDVKTDLDMNVFKSNLKKHLPIRLKYKPDTHKLIPNYDDRNILKGRELAMEVSNQSDYNKDSVSIIKYNHGFLPGHGHLKKLSNKEKSMLKINHNMSGFNGKSNFNKHVKIGNALNEAQVIGFNEEQKKESFVGGNERIPDINRYRSDIDDVRGNVPPSLKPKICRNVELYDPILYIQPDESIDMTHILSPIKKKNIGIDFIGQNYKKCSLEESALGKSNLLLLHWNKTPVRLFGGAHTKKTTDLCGFF